MKQLLLNLKGLELVSRRQLLSKVLASYFTIDLSNSISIWTFIYIFFSVNYESDDDDNNNNDNDNNDDNNDDDNNDDNNMNDYHNDSDDQNSSDDDY